MDDRRAPQRSRFQVLTLLALPTSLLSALLAMQIATSAAPGGKSDRSAAVVSVSTSSGWPDATNTGVPAGLKLVPSGGLVINTPGVVISGLDIRGAVEINASHVTLKNSRVRTARFNVIYIKPGLRGVVIQDCEIDGIGSGNAGSNGISGAGTFVRNNIHHVENGIVLNGSAVILDNYVHNLLASGSPHYDGIQIDGGIANVLIRHNTVINAHVQTSAVMIDNYFGPISDIVVDNNRLVGGGYSVYSDGKFGGGAISGVSFTNNRLGKGRWGYSSFVNNEPIWHNNVDDMTGRNLVSR
jgi:hypothetical protein